MQGVKGLIVLSAVIAAVALGACRREVEHTPMKLGADVPPPAKVTNAMSSRPPTTAAAVTKATGLRHAGTLAAGAYLASR